MFERLSQKSVSLNPLVWHSNSYLTFNHSHGMQMTLGWHTNGISVKKFELFRSMKLKLEQEYSHLKLWSMCNMLVIFILLCFLLILLVSILFSVSNCFVCYFRLLKFTLGGKRLNIAYVSGSIQQERLSIGLEVGRIYF